MSVLLIVPRIFQYWLSDDECFTFNEGIYPLLSYIDTTSDRAIERLIQRITDNRRRRKEFIRKVYKVVGFQVLITVATALFIWTFFEDIYSQNAVGIRVFSALMSFLLCALISEYRRSYPANVILTSFFSVARGIVLGPDLGLSGMAALSVFVFVAITYLTVQLVFRRYSVRQIFRRCFFLAGAVLCGVALLASWVKIASCFAAFAFCLAIIHDTVRVMRYYDVKDYFQAANILYEDMLFLVAAVLISRGTWFLY